jgi:hypothetical protein
MDEQVSDVKASVGREVDRKLRADQRHGVSHGRASSWRSCSIAFGRERDGDGDVRRVRKLTQRRVEMEKVRV